MKANIFLFGKHSRYLTVLSVNLTEVERSQRKSSSSHIKMAVLERNMWPTRKVSSHFEYLENWSRGLDVTWQTEETVLRILERLLSHGLVSRQ